MKKTRVVISALGVVSALGMGKEDFFKGLIEGKSAIKPITFFELERSLCSYGGEITNFTPQDYLGKKGLREFDRSTRMALTATMMAINELDGEEFELEKAGLTMGTAFGSVHSIATFDRDSLSEGPRSVRPLAFPNTVINSPASRVSIKFGMSRFNTTISTGFAAGLDSFGYALDFIRAGRAEVVFCGALEELSIESFTAFSLNGLLADDTEEGHGMSCPYSKASRGFFLGEGAAIFVLESLEHALARGATILGEVAGYGTACDASFKLCPEQEKSGAERAVRAALKDASLMPGEIELIYGSANGNPIGDRVELRALEAGFNEVEGKIPLIAIKAALGECFGASGALQSAAALMSLRTGTIPPTLHNDRERPGRGTFLINSEKVVGQEFKTALINSFDCKGASSSLIIKRYEG